MQNHKIYKNPILLSFLLAIMVADLGCSKPSGDFYNYKNEIHSFNGSSLDFLKSQPGVFDSFLLVLNRFPAIRDSVANDSVTVVAPTNQSFRIALTLVNAIRHSNNLPPIWLASLDSAKLDTLISRYVLRNKTTTTQAIPYVDGIDVYGIQYGYRMHFTYSKGNASGVLLAGPQSLMVSDTKNSDLNSVWIQSPTSSVDVMSKNGIVHTLVVGHEFGFGEFSKMFNK